jgi:preprotein translocase subunit YajC
MEALTGILPFVLIFGVFWFFLIRPQQKQQKAHKEMLSRLKAGDEVITIGGIKGKIIKIKDNNIRLRVSSNVDIDVIKTSIRQLNPEVEQQQVEVQDNQEEEKKE